MTSNFNDKRAWYDFWQSRDGRSLSGLMFMHKHNYVAVEGSNSVLERVGFEDVDLQIRLQVKLDLERIALGSRRI